MFEIVKSSLVIMLEIVTSSLMIMVEIVTSSLVIMFEIVTSSVPILKVGWAIATSENSSDDQDYEWNIIQMTETNWVLLIDHGLLKCWSIFYDFLMSGGNITVYQLNYGV